MPAKNETQVSIATLPNSVEAEQNVLCCILRNESIQLEIIAALCAEDFYQRNHAEIFAAMKHVSSQSHKVGTESMSNTVNFTTVVDHLRRNGKLLQVGDIDYILKLNDVLPSTAKYQEYISIVKRASTMRRLIEICGNVTKKAYSEDSSESAITYAEEEIFKLAQRGTNAGLTELSGTVAQALVNISERFVNPGKFRGIETGFKRFDRLTNGLHGGELVILAARPGIGKSAMAMNMVENVAKSGKTVAVFSLEMSNEQLVERLLSSMSGVPLEFIKSGQLPGGELDLVKLQKAHGVISSSMKLYGNDYANIKPAEISSQCRRLKAQNGLDLIVIDYIQLMNSDGKANEGRQNEVASITRALKLMAKELNVPVLALSQLKRDAEIRNIKTKGTGDTAGSEPVLSDLRESGAIEQDADIVLFIHRENAEDKNNDKVSLIVAKHRNGETGSIPLLWLGRLVRFIDPEKLNEIPVERKTAISAQNTNVDFVSDEGQDENGGFVIDEEYSEEFTAEGTADGEIKE